ncbi:MAG: hypothetical protein K0R53_2781 [Burkholderiales bacterium]|jgi:hypothetical protein|nr:hypothetical protein [Burkholderiales bacterium]
MATGNPGTATVSNAAAAASPIKSDCEELADANAARREELGGKTSDKTLVGPDKSGKGTTVSSVKRTPVAGGTSSVRSAHNNQKAHEKCQKTLAKGGSPEVRSGAAKTMCGSHTHDAPCEQKSGHAEARLLDELPNGPPQRMTINIDWRPKRGAPSKMPCESCHKLICAAREHCKHEITLCAAGKPPKAVPVDDTHCPPTKSSYLKLQGDMGEF